MISDEDLMKRYVAGDIKAFEMLYLKHKGPLYRYFIRQCKDTHKAEELYQDVWHKVIKAKENYKNSAKFTTWVYHIAHNLLIDEYRRFTLVSSDINDLDELDSGSDNNLADNLVEQDVLKQLKICIKTLPAVQLEAFILKQEAGFDLLEISNIVNCDKETIKSRIRYAYSKIKICIKTIVYFYTFGNKTRNKYVKI